MSPKQFPKQRSLNWLRGWATGSAIAVWISGCVIQERKYNPDIGADGGVVTKVTEFASPELCREYCTTVTKNCTGGYVVYLGTDANNDGVSDDCMAICQHLKPGTEGDKSNTVQCRLGSAISAASEQTDQACAGAGPGGNTICGNTCDTYCRLRAELCADQESAQELDINRCLYGCPALDPGDIYNADPMTREDTLQCRLNHLVFASRSPESAVTHCPHTSVVPQWRDGDPDPPCADQRGTPGDCSKYCNLVMGYSCTGADSVYETKDQCLAVCKAFPLGTAEQTGNKAGENTVACRHYHAYAALGPDGPDVHCPHAGPTGDGACGTPAADDNCFSYCRILKRSCSTRFFQTFLPGQTPPASPVDNADTDDLGTCMDTCKALPGNTPASGYSVQTADKAAALQCRVLHAIRALGGPNSLAPDNLSPDNLSPDKECAAAFGEGACQ